MSRFGWLGIAVALAFALTLGLDLYQRRLAYPGKEIIIFASMWAPGEPFQQAHEKLFAEFEREYPRYKIEARWDGRWVLPSIRPRLLTGSDIPDVFNFDLDGLRILIDEGYALPLDEFLEKTPHPDEPGKNLGAAFHPKLLARCRVAPTPLPQPLPQGEGGARSRVESSSPSPGGRGQGEGEASAATYLVPSGLETYLIFYNRAHYEKLGLSIPKTWSQFLENCRRLKEAGITPLAADQDAYCDAWYHCLIRRAMSEELWFATLRGAGLRFDDPRFRAVFQAIRDLHQPGWFMDGWEGSQWPAAQRHWVTGKATHMINGTWLIRETLTYGSNAQEFRPGAFLVPRLDRIDWQGRAPAEEPDASSIDAFITGYALLKGSRNRAGGETLAAFLSRRTSAQVLADIGKEIPAVRGVAYPKELAELRADIENAKTLHNSDTAYASKWVKFVCQDLYFKFFMHESPRDPEFLTVDEFLRQLQARTDRYIASEGETGIK